MRIDAQMETADRLHPEQSNPRETRVLLIGENAQGSSYLTNRLNERGFHCEFATSYLEASLLLANQSFRLVLSPTRLRGTSLLPLMDLLEGTNVTLFFAHAVEQSCWWLPGLRRGRRCFGSYAIPPSEFVSVLDEAMDEVRLYECGQRVSTTRSIPQVNLSRR